MNSTLTQKFDLKTANKLLPYFGIFIILFTGSYVKNLSDGSLIFFLIKYCIIALILGLAIYFFLKKDNLNFLKLTIFIPFTIDYQLQLAFIFLTLILFNKKLLVPFKSPLKPIYLLFGLGLISYAVNQFIQFNLLSFPLFIFTFFLPFIFFGLFYNYGYNYKDDLIKFFYNVVLIMSGIIVLQCILNPELHPDYWNGGTPNAHIAAAYISIAFIMSIVKLERLVHRPFKKYFREIIISVFTLPLLFLTDAKYFLLLVIFILIIYFIAIPSVSRHLKALSVGVLVILSIIFFSTPDKPIPISILTVHKKSYNFTKVNADFYNSPKYLLLKAASRLPFEEPLTFCIGSGPGTFISRAALIQYNLSNKQKSSTYNYGREKFPLSSKIALEDTWIRNKYAKFAFPDTFDPGSLYNRRSGLLSIFFEMGIIGLILYILFYLGIVKAMWKQNSALKEKQDFTLILLTVLFFAMNYFAYWCEYQNYGIIQYGIMGLLAAGVGKKSVEG